MLHGSMLNFSNLRKTVAILLYRSEYAGIIGNSTDLAELVYASDKYVLPQSPGTNYIYMWMIKALQAVVFTCYFGLCQPSSPQEAQQDISSKVWQEWDAEAKRFYCAQSPRVSLPGGYDPRPLRHRLRVHGGQSDSVRRDHGYAAPEVGVHQ